VKMDPVPPEPGAAQDVGMEVNANGGAENAMETESTSDIAAPDVCSPHAKPDTLQVPYDARDLDVCMQKGLPLHPGDPVRTQVVYRGTGALHDLDASMGEWDTKYAEDASGARIGFVWAFKRGDGGICKPEVTCEGMRMSDIFSQRLHGEYGNVGDDMEFVADKSTLKIYDPFRQCLEPRRYVAAEKTARARMHVGPPTFYGMCSVKKSHSICKISRLLLNSLI
jgi:hypothetical protein